MEVEMTDLSALKDSYLEKKCSITIQGLLRAVATNDWERGFDFNARVAVELDHQKVHFPLEQKLVLIRALWTVLAEETEMSPRAMRKVLEVLTLLLKYDETILLLTYFPFIYLLLCPFFPDSQASSRTAAPRRLRLEGALQTGRANRLHDGQDARLRRHQAPQVCSHLKS
jgi:hypothetical protein